MRFLQRNEDDEDDDDDDNGGYRLPAMKDPEYAHVKKKVEREPGQRPPVSISLTLCLRTMYDR